MHNLTAVYSSQLPQVPVGWSWYVWEDVVDGRLKIFVRLRDEKLHAKGHGSIDVATVGRYQATLELAREIAAARVS